MRVNCLVSIILASAAIVSAQDVGSPNQIAAQKFYRDTQNVQTLFVNGDLDAAKTFAHRLLEDAEGFPKDWNYGNAVHAANVVLGRIAIKEKDHDAAEKFLLAAGKTPGSPQLDTFGPDMNLARELLAAGEKQVVLEYFDLCEKFWRMNDGRLAEWSKVVRRGEVPDFGPNLRYFAFVPDN